MKWEQSLSQLGGRWSCNNALMMIRPRVLLLLKLRFERDIWITQNISTAITATVSVTALSFINDQQARPGRLLEWLMRNDRVCYEIILVLHCCWVLEPWEIWWFDYNSLIDQFWSVLRCCQWLAMLWFMLIINGECSRQKVENTTRKHVRDVILIRNSQN